MRLRDFLTALPRRLAEGFALLAFGAAPALADPQSFPTPVAPVLREIPPPPLHPALWMVKDEDTTIYLFGTIHALRPGMPWFGGQVAQAFSESATLVTEISNVDGMDTAQTLLGNALLPQGQTLRGKLSVADRAAFDAALARNSIPAAALDRFKPWYAAVVLSSLPLLRAGFKLEEGVEIQLAAKAKAAGKSQEALETAAYQLGLFDSLPEAGQQAYLRQVVDNLDQLTAQIDTLIGEWGEGDADGLAKAMNAEESDAGLTELLLTRRNKAWAEWIKTRLDQPGTVFMAVGAGHLAGPGSVQEQLVAKGLAATRVQ
ncbi:MAG: TraB/GumN family protein [Novosphingobium sp.]|nr:TraB/GumN family protein [Novosphingobium sp.]